MQTRRQFVVRTGTTTATAILSPSAMAAGLDSARKVKLAHGGRFSEGVMSGEPTPSAITLWTRLADIDGAVGVDLEVATDKSFRHVVAHKRLTTSAAVNHNVKSRITGLKAHEQYYYRFATATKDGQVGRFRTTLPADSLQPVRFAFWSCQDYTHGYYNAHERMANEDLDFVVCLGDYIYDETYHTVKDGTGVRDDKTGRAQQESGQAGVNYSRAAETLTSTRQVRAVSLGRVAAQDAVALPGRDALGRPRGAGRLRRRRARKAGCRQPSLLPQAPGGRLPGVLRDDALHAAVRTADAHLPAAAVRAHRRPAGHGPAPVPGRPAVRRRDSCPRAPIATNRAASSAPGR